jgi:hypothetical protein
LDGGGATPEVELDHLGLKIQNRSSNTSAELKAEGSIRYLRLFSTQETTGIDIRAKADQAAVEIGAVGLPGELIIRTGLQGDASSVVLDGADLEWKDIDVCEDGQAKKISVLAKKASST